MSNQYERVSNQDKIGEIVGGRSPCFVVCYSFAGLPAGDIAASMTRNTMMQRFDVQHYLNVQLIRQQQKSEPDYHRMGTTLVSLFIDRDYQLAYWEGARDRRLYIFRRGYLYNVTIDHSLVQQMKGAGHQTEGINTNLLYFALGMGDEHRHASYSNVVPTDE